MLVRAVVWAFCLPLLPVCWLQLKLIRRQPPKIDGVTLLGAWPDNVSTSSVARRVLGLGDQAIVPGDSLNSGQGITAYCTESLIGQADRETTWQVAGQAGATAGDVLATCRGIDDLKVDLILISMGINDVSRLTSLMRWQARIFDLIFLIRQKGTPKIIFLGLPPMARFQALPQPLRAVCGVRARLMDAVLKRSVSGLDFAAHLDFETGAPAGAITEDGYHLTAEVQKALGARAASLGLHLLRV